MKGFRKKYLVGVDHYYENNTNYKNLHSSKFNNIVNKIIKYFPLKIKQNVNLLNFLDFSCGSGEITLSLMFHNIHNIEGFEPYLHQSYVQNTGKNIIIGTFNDVIERKLYLTKYILIICSYCLHLCDNVNELLIILKESTEYLCVISPHGLPIISADITGWYELFSFKYSNIKVNFYTTNVEELNENNENSKEEKLTEDDQLETFSNFFESVDPSTTPES